MHSCLSALYRKFRVRPDCNHRTLPNTVGQDRRLKFTTLTARHQITIREKLWAIYQWITCLFVIFLVLAQLFGAVWNTTTTTRHLDYGRKPELGPFQIVGTNDVPYADRAIACVRRGRKYEPRLLSSLLAAEDTDAILEDRTGTAKHGYRLVQRRAFSVSDALDSAVYLSYRDVCSLIASTMDSILGACSALGYTNLTTDNLRVVESADSARLFRIPNSLPVLIMPFWDNSGQGRHAVPAWGGDACVFRLEDAYSGSSNGATDTSVASFRGVNRTVRHERTSQWLKRPGGSWSNGWYEDLEGGRWFSDVTSSNPGAPYYMTYRAFDMRSGLEMNCTRQEDCLATPRVSRWGTKFTTYEYPQDLNSITILNGSSFGLFLFDTNQANTVKIIYDWETLVSNLSVSLVLLRWVLTLIALHIGSMRGKLPCFGGGIGCVSGYKNFDFLLISMIPQLKMALTAFWTVGCRFEGQQVGLSEAWFTIYPAIAQLMLMYYSLLNALAKITRRRMSDVLFGPSIMFLCALHFYRSDLASSALLSDVDGRVSTFVFSDEVKNMQLLDYFTSDLAWRINGRVTVLFWTKLAVLGANCLPLVVARPFPVVTREMRRYFHGIEQALAIKANHVGGLGASTIYLSTSADVHVIVPTNSDGGSVVCSESNGSVTAERTPYLNSYDLLRLGYVVFGDCYIVSFDDWDILSSMAPLRSFYHLWNHRVCVWTLQGAETDNNSRGLRTLLSLEPEIWRLDDKRLHCISWWKISSYAIRC